MRCFYALLIVSCLNVWAQTPSGTTNPSSLQVNTFFGLNSNTQVIDNRSVQNRQDNVYSYCASGSGAWSMQLEHATASTGPWTSFGASSIVTNTSSNCVGIAVGYQPFVRLNPTVGTPSATLSMWKNLFISATAGGIGSGTVTSFSAGTLSPLFTTGVSNPTTVPALSFSLSNVAANSLFGNATGSTGTPGYSTVSAYLDSAVSSTQGTLVYRGASGWVGLAPGTSGQFLQSQGASANPLWAFGLSGTVTTFSSGNLAPLFTTSVGTPTSTPAQTYALSNAAGNSIFGNATGTTGAPSYNSVSAYLDSAFSSSQGSVLYRSVSGWTALAPGSTGQFLQTLGPSANPQWAAGGGAPPFSAITSGINLTTLTVGSGGSLVRTGSGIIDANQILGTVLTSLTGVIKMTVGVPGLAAGADIVSLFSACSGVQYLGADAACHNPAAGGGPAGATNSIQKNGGSGSFAASNLIDTGSQITTTVPVGIGPTPSSTFNFDMTKSGSAGIARFFDQTASTGSTTVQIRAGAAQTIGSCTSYLLWFLPQSGGTTPLSGVDCAGDFNGVNFNNGLKKVAVVGTSTVLNTRGDVDFSSDSILLWKSVTNIDAMGTYDLGMGRSSAGFAEINNGTIGTWRDLKIRNLTSTGDCDVEFTSTTQITIFPTATVTGPCIFGRGLTSSTVSAPATVTMTSGTATLYVSVGASGAITVGAGSASVTCSGCTATADTGFPVDAKPIWTWALASGVVGATGGTDYRALLSYKPSPAAGRGIIVTAGDQDTIATDSTSIAMKFSGSGAPGSIATSSLGDTYINTSSGAFYVCTNASGACTSVAGGQWVLH